MKVKQLKWKEIDDKLITTSNIKSLGAIGIETQEGGEKPIYVAWFYAIGDDGNVAADVFVCAEKKLEKAKEKCQKYVDKRIAKIVKECVEEL